MTEATPIVVAYVAGVVTATWLAFRVLPARRPWLGVLTGNDVAVIAIVVLLAPYLYLRVGGWVGAVVFSALLAGSSYLLTTAGMGRRAAIAAAVAAVGGVTVASALAGERGDAASLVDGAGLALLVVGWSVAIAHSGARARHVAALAGALTVLAVGTGWGLLLVTDLVDRSHDAVFIPLFGWGDVAVGLGDVLVAALFPIVAIKAYGSAAGCVAAVASIAAIAVVVGLRDADAVSWSPMVVLGPLVVVQHTLWRSARGRERTTFEYSTT